MSDLRKDILVESRMDGAEKVVNITSFRSLQTETTLRFSFQKVKRVPYHFYTIVSAVRGLVG